MSVLPLAEELARLESSLLELVSSLECDPLPSEGVLDSSWSRVHRSFESVRSLLATAREPADDHVEPLERCQRLHVLATGLLTRRRDELAAEQQSFRRLRARLASIRNEARGDSCDLRA